VRSTGTTKPRRTRGTLVTTIDAAAFAPKALRRASPELVENIGERRRESAEHVERSIGKNRRY